jgi:hypothetical protein
VGRAHHANLYLQHPMLGAPASISWGRSFLSLLCSGPSSLPRPDALSPPPAAPMPCGFLCRRAQTTSERLPLPGRSTPSPAFLALSGRGDATFHVGLNFALTEFSEVRSSQIAPPGPLYALLSLSGSGPARRRCACSSCRARWPAQAGPREEAHPIAQLLDQGGSLTLDFRGVGVAVGVCFVYPDVHPTSVFSERSVPRMSLGV